MRNKAEYSSISFGLQVLSEGEPAWRQLYSQIKQRLSNGTLQAGDSMPAERELAEQVGVSRGTVKRCYDQLRIEGVLGGRGRSGSVLQHSVSKLPVLGQLKGFTQEMRELGKVASTQLVTKQAVVDRAMTSLFQQNSQQPLLHLVRIRLADDVPMTRENAWYNLSEAPALIDWSGDGSIYDYLSRHCGVHFGQAIQTVEAVLSNKEESAAFGFSVAQPCLLFKRKVFDEKNNLIEYVEGCFRGDLYAYQIPLQI